jgi:hypothetical protein
VRIRDRMAGAHARKVGDVRIGVHGPGARSLVRRLRVLAGLLEARHVRAACAQQEDLDRNVVVEVRLAKK